MSSSTQFSADSMIDIEKTITVKAPKEVVFEVIVSQAGMDHNPNGEKMNIKLEPWPGGRWYRDLGNNTGHFWGHVQVIKPPTVLEITGPMFMSYPVMSHMQYRLTEENGVTTVKLTHRAVGLIPEEHRKGVQTGWQLIMDNIKKLAEK